MSSHRFAVSLLALISTFALSTGSVPAQTTVTSERPASFTLGNGIDRFLHGAVVDFALFHLEIGGKTFNWYVFNLADVAIVAGVAGLLYDSFLGVPAAKAP